MTIGNAKIACDLVNNSKLANVLISDIKLSVGEIQYDKY
jgi:hypothetical protein